MKTTLNHVAEISTGLTLKRRVDDLGDGSTAIIQMKDLSDLNKRLLPRRDVGPVKSHQFIKPGDLIFRSRGASFGAVVFNWDEPAIAAAPLIVIRVKDNAQVLPEYLSWYISQPIAQRFFSTRSEGSSLKMLSQKHLLDLEVELPSFEQQKEIALLGGLMERETHLTKKLINRKKLHMSGLLLRQARGDS